MVSGQLHVPAALPPERDTPYPLIGGWVGPRTGLDTGEMREISFPCWELNPGRPAPSRSSYAGSYIPYTEVVNCSDSKRVQLVHDSERRVRVTRDPEGRRQFTPTRPDPRGIINNIGFKKRTDFKVKSMFFKNKWGPFCLLCAAIHILCCV
jgi:hypothetical protein